jgi:hypothetical protein
MFPQVARQYRTFERIDWHSKSSNIHAAIRISITNKTTMTALKILHAAFSSRSILSPHLG